MNIGISKQQADELVEKYITNPITKLHLLESEAIMRALAKYFGENEDEWGIVGLLHDIDWDLSKDDTKNHCKLCVDILKDAGGTDFLIETIQSHGYGIESCGAPVGKERSTKIEFSLVSAETLTGLIIATALMQPDKKLASVSLQSLKKKFKNKKFAAGCRRDLIQECEKAGIPLDEFLDLGLKALQNIHDKLGL
jgi:uncharacterized protein